MTAPNKKPYLNSRQHRFCLNILAGMLPQQAWVSAGYSSHPDSVGSHPYQLLLDNQAVKQFIADKRRLQEDIVGAVSNAALKEAALSKAEKRQILADIARSSLADHLDENGDIKLSKAKAKALKEYYARTHTDRDGNTTVTKSVRLLDIIAAIQEDNKMDGSYAPSKHLVAQKVVFEVRMTSRKRNDSERELAPSGEIKELEEGAEGENQSWPADDGLTREEKQ